MSDNELVEIKRESAMAVFTTAGGVDPFLAAIKAEVDAFVPGDVAIKKERERIASMAYKLARTGSYLEGVGKELADEAKAIPKKIDAARKAFKDTIGQWKDQVRAPLTAWEQVEEARVARITQQVEEWQAVAQDHGQRDSEAIRDRLAEVKAVAVTEEAFQEFTAAAGQAKDAAVTALEGHLASALKREAEAAELALLRKQSEERAAKERDERIAAEAATRAKAEAETKARRAQDEADARATAAAAAAKNRELKLQAYAERAKREAAEANERAVRAEQEAKAKAERDHAAKLKAEKEAADKREANKAHRGRIMKAAKEALMGFGLSEEVAKTVVLAISDGKVPAVQINY